MNTDRLEAGVSKKINHFMKFLMGFSISFALATYGVVASGHFSIKMWGLSLLLSFILTFIITVAFPIHKIAEVVAGKIKFKFLTKLVSVFVVNFFYVFIITTVLVCVMLTMANREISTKADELSKELKTVEEGIKDCEAKLAEIPERTHEYIEVNTQYSELKDTQKIIKERIKKLESDKPSIVKTLPKSLVVSFALSFLFSLVLEPVYLRIAKRRYIKRPSVDDLE